MNITLIGTGAIYSKYNSACTLINDDMIVDVPNGILKQLLRKNHIPEKINKILITYMHGDHTADIPFLLMYLYKNKKVERNTYIIGPKGIENKVKQLCKIYHYHFLDKIDSYIKYIEIKPNEILENPDILYKIEAIPVLHGKEKPAYGYIIDNQLGLSGDSAFCEGVQTIVKNSEITIADCSRIYGDESHMGIDNLSFLAKEYHKNLIATHMKDETREELENLKIASILVKEDGYKFEL